MNDSEKQFLEVDNIDQIKYLANLHIMKNNSINIYKATLNINKQEDLSDYCTKTIEWMASPLNQPIGYPTWFMVAYPDVIRWFSDLEDNEIISVIGEPTLDLLNENSNFKLPILRKIVDSYKNISVLECSK